MLTTTKSLYEQDSNTFQSAVESPLHHSVKPAQPDPQVKTVTRIRRTFTKAYKLKILVAYDICSNASERGALLRREGLYQTRIASWRKQFGSNEVASKVATKNQRTDHLVREVEQLKKKLAQAQAIIDLQKKVSELLGTHILSHESSEEKS